MSAQADKLCTKQDGHQGSIPLQSHHMVNMKSALDTEHLQEPAAWSCCHLRSN
jgi:hypothetical protein